MSFICFDTEDDSKELLTAGKSGFLKQVTQIAAITRTGKRFYNTGNRKEFLSWLNRQPERFIYSLNIQYDLGNLFGDEIDTLDTTLVNGRVIKSVWGTKTFVDVFNIWPMSVAKIGQAFGLEKLETGDMAHDKKYVFRDTEIIKRAMDFAWQFCELLGIEYLPPTLGGLCVKIWKHWGGQNNHDSTNISREALYGGRVELFKERNDSSDVCWTDINSLYPSVMCGLFPGPIEQYEPRMATLERMKHGVARCTVKVPRCEIAPLPYREEDGRILYPWGKFSGVWTLPELKNAMAHGTRIVKLQELWGTNEESRPYATFVHNLYEMRLQAKTDAEKLFYKLLMNNLYGRLGTTGVIGRTVWLTEKNRNDGVAFGERTLVNYHMPLSEETNWLHAAYVTSYGRLEVQKFLRIVGKERMIYCDTDSTIFDCPDKRIPFPVGDGLGIMKIEKMCKACKGHWQDGKEKCCNLPGRGPSDFWEGCETYAPKQYHVGNIFKAKGVPKRLQAEFIRTGRAEFDLPFKIREAIRFFDRNNSHKLSVWRRVVKEQRGEYDKKRVENNRYFPLQLARG